MHKKKMNLIKRNVKEINKFYEKSEFRKAGESESSDSENDLKQFEPKLTDTELIKRQRYVDHNQGNAFMDEDGSKETEEILNSLSTQQKKQKLKEKLLNKNLLSTDIIDAEVDEEAIPLDFGKNKAVLGNKEKFKLFSRVKRDIVQVEETNLIKRHDIDVDEDDDLIGPPIPKDILFSKDEPKQISKEVHEENKVEEKVEETKEAINEKHSTSSVNEEFEDIDKILFDNNIPISHETIWAGHSKGVIALDIDPSGNRMATGGYDETVRLWDFQGMNRTMTSFKEFVPHEGYPVLCLSYSNTGNQFLWITGSWHAKVLSRDGKQLKETIRGDMYIRDTFNTKGHVSSLTDGMWHPILKNKFLTGSIDGTIRLWDIESKLVGVDQQLMQERVTKALHHDSSRPVKVYWCRFSHDGNSKAAGWEDGTIKLWDEKGPNYRPVSSFKDAHAPGSEISSIIFYSDSKRMLSRAMDDTLKFWDWRFPSEPINVWSDLMNYTSKTNVCLSPDEKIIITGESVKRGMGNSWMHFYNSDSFEKIWQIGVSEGNVVRTMWHPKINQIFATSTDNNTRIYFDPDMSNRGALNWIVKEPRKHQADDMQYGNPILAPHALPQFKQTYTSATKRLKKEEEEKKEKEKKTYEFGSSWTYQQYIMKMINKNTQRDEDPREALIKFNETSEKEPLWVAGAYLSTQPKAVFNYETVQRESHQFVEDSEAKICPKWGLKFCTWANKTVADDDEED